MMNDVLSSAFSMSAETAPSLTEFFEKIKELDKHICYIPIKNVMCYTPAHNEDGENFFDADEYSCTFYARAHSKISKKKVKIDTLLDAGADLESFIEELLAFKDSLFITESDMFFVTEEAFRGFSKLSGLSGDALKNATKYRDDYISSLIRERCVKAAGKRKVKPAFTAIAFENCGIKRVFQARSGNYENIPQSILEDVFNSLMEADDWGEVVCKNWHIDHDISYVDIEFPELSESLRELYPEEFHEASRSLPMIPGIRLSTGSTGFNSLKASMTWRKAESEYPGIYESVTQKHCATYEGESFISKCHENIWERYGELPARLAELYMKPLPERREEIEVLAKKICKEMNFAKIFMQKEDLVPKTEKADYVSKIVDMVTNSMSMMEDATAYDMAMSFMDIADTIIVADSYKESVRNALMKVPFCKAFD